ncbi:MAG TPA: alkaline phosphatase [Opitutales bacterium]|nr:alkaline phosphatase [Opitutales bacterium]
MNRRNFLKTGLASSLLIGSGSLLNGRALTPKTAARARNVIFLVSDGMSNGTLSLADQFIRWRDGHSSNWIRLYEEEKARKGFVETASANSIVTDSAAGASSWGCGHRVNNGSLNIGVNGEEHPPILLLAKENGKATGLVTTATATHATPAGFSVNVPTRRNQPLIAEQYLEREIDLIFGGGEEFFSADRRSDGRDLFKEFAEAGYGIARTREELKSVNGDRLLGIFSRGHLPYELDRSHSPDLSKTVPSLSEMARVALEQLNRRPDGFVLQIEGGRVDHGAHANDIGALIFDQIEFDKTIAVATEFAEKHGDTLVIITTDHGNANPGLSSGPDGGEKTFSTLSNFRGTHQPILSALNKDSSPEEITARIQEITQLKIPSEHSKTMQEALQQKYQPVYNRMRSPSALLGQILANHTDIGWIGNSHTSDHVEVAALGPGSDALKLFQKNTDLFTMMTNALGITAPAVSG